MLLCISFLLLSLFSSLSNAESSQTLDWRCSDGAIMVLLSTRDPFEGSLMARGRAKQCGIIGNGNTTTVLFVPLSDLEKCNVTLDEISHTYSLTVEIHSHPVLVLDNDREVVVKCSARDFQTTTERNVASSSSFKISFLEGDFEEKLKDGILGKSYSIEVRNVERNDERPFEVIECRAFGADNLSVALTDGRGCPTVPFLEPFKFSLANRSSEEEEDHSYRSIAKISSMFRFPNTENVHIQCVVRLCEGGEKCQSPCLTAKDSPITPDTVRALLNDVASSEVGGEMDGYVASGMIRVLDQDDQPTIATAAEASSTSIIPCKVSDEVTMLYAACIGLFVAFLMGCCCNSLFCFIINKRRVKEKREQTVREQENKPDFWIRDAVGAGGGGKQALESPGYFDSRRMSGASYASVKKTRLSKMPSEYGVPQTHVVRPPPQHSQLSDYGSSDGREYGSSREFGATNSTFLSHSLTMETELDSPGSNQTSSYH